MKLLKSIGQIILGLGGMFVMLILILILDAYIVIGATINILRGKE